MHASPRTALVLTAGLLVAGATVSSAYAATSATDVQANSPQIARPLPDVTGVFPNNKQNEPSIAVSRDGVHLVAGSNDEQQQPDCGPGPRRGPDADAADCSFFPGVGTDGVYLSADGGTSWRNLGLIDDQASWQASPYVSDGDPVLAFGPRPDGRGGFSRTLQRVYYQSLASWKTGQSPYSGGTGGAGTIVVSFSDDFGATWSAPVQAGPRGNPVTFNDKNALAVDNDVRSPYFGRAYSSWTAFRSATVNGNGSEPIEVASSPDGGLTWSAPDQLSPAGNNSSNNGRQGSAVSTTPDGTVLVAFEQGAAQVVAISRDGGRSFTRPRTVGPVTDIPDPIPGANFRTDSFPSLSGDPSDVTGARAYAAWVTRTATGGALVLYRTTDHGITWARAATVATGSSTSAQGFPFFQGLDVAPNGRVDIGWQALTARNAATFGTGNAAIRAWYASYAAGAVSAPVTVSTASSDPAASAQNNLQRQFWGDYNTLVSTNATAWVIYTDSRHGVGCPAVDTYQRFLVSSGAVVEQEEKEPNGAAGADAQDDSTKPAPPEVCPRAFGDTDAYVSVITP